MAFDGITLGPQMLKIRRPKDYVAVPGIEMGGAYVPGVISTKVCVVSSATMRRAFDGHPTKHAVRRWLIHLISSMWVDFQHTLVTIRSTLYELVDAGRR